MLRGLSPLGFVSGSNLQQKQPGSVPSSVALVYANLQMAEKNILIQVVGTNASVSN